MRSTGWTIALLWLSGCFTDMGPTGQASSTGEPGSSSSSSSSSEPVSTGDTTGPTPTTSGTTSDSDATTGPQDGDPCDPWAPVCPEGSKCAAYAEGGGPSWNANKCVPAGNDGDGQGCTIEGSATSGEDSCKAGFMCWDVDPQLLTGVCYALCGGSKQTPSCGINSTCFSSNNDSVNLCVAECDPLDDAGCDGVCVYDGNSQQFICLIDASGPTLVGDPCESINTCPPGSVCDDPGLSSACDQQADGCCLAYCDASDMLPCPMDQMCLAFFEMGTAPAGLENLGLCVTA
jgi:hypothetical protein